MCIITIIIILIIIIIIIITNQFTDHKNELSNKNEGMWALTVKVRQGSSKRNYISSLNRDRLSLKQITRF